MDTSLATKAEMRRVARRKMERGDRQCCDTCHNFAHGGKPLPPDQGMFFYTGHGLFWNCHPCVDAITRKTVRDSMERKGLPHAAQLPVLLPRRKVQHRRRMPQYCSECNNGLGGCVLLPSAQGEFLSDHRGERWVCNQCIDENNCAACTSPDEKSLHAWLVSEHISHRMQAIIGGALFDCHVPDWKLVIELDISSPHHAVTRSWDACERDRIASEHGLLPIHLKWDDHAAVARIRAAARKFGMRRQKRHD